MAELPLVQAEIEQGRAITKLERQLKQYQNKLVKVHDRIASLQG